MYFSELTNIDWIKGCWGRCGLQQSWYPSSDRDRESNRWITQRFILST